MKNDFKNRMNVQLIHVQAATNNSCNLAHLKLKIARCKENDQFQCSSGFILGVLSGIVRRWWGVVAKFYTTNSQLLCHINVHVK